MNEIDEIRLRWRTVPIDKEPVLVAVAARDDIGALLSKIDRLQTVITDIDKLGCATIAMQRDTFRDSLTRLEWVDFGGIDGCPVCHRRSTNPHTDDCWLAEVLYGQ